MNNSSKLETTFLKTLSTSFQGVTRPTLRKNVHIVNDFWAPGSALESEMKVHEAFVALGVESRLVREVSGVLAVPTRRVSSNRKEGSIYFARKWINDRWLAVYCILCGHSDDPEIEVVFEYFV